MEISWIWKTQQLCSWFLLEYNQKSHIFSHQASSETCVNVYNIHCIFCVYSGKVCVSPWFKCLPSLTNKSRLLPSFGRGRRSRARWSPNSALYWYTTHTHIYKKTHTNIYKKIHTNANTNKQTYTYTASRSRWIFNSMSNGEAYLIFVIFPAQKFDTITRISRHDWFYDKHRKLFAIFIAVVVVVEMVLELTNVEFCVF